MMRAIRDGAADTIREVYTLLTRRAKRAGFSVKVDTTLRCRHVGANGVGVPEALGWQAVKRQRSRSSVAAPARTEEMA